MTFDETVAQSYDKWYQTDFGSYSNALEERLIKDLLGETKGLQILDMGCGTGRHLKLFESLGSDPVGVDPSIFMLRKAKEKGKPKLILANGEELPLKNSVFDVTILMTTLEFCENPTKILQEAGRVTRDRMFIGVLNSWSILAIGRRVKGWFKPSIYSRADFLSTWKLKRLVRNSIAFESLEWKGVHPVPCGRTRFLRWLDRKLSFRKNPFAAFLGVLVTLKPGSSA